MAQQAYTESCAVQVVTAQRRTAYSHVQTLAFCHEYAAGSDEGQHNEHSIYASLHLL